MVGLGYVGGGGGRLQLVKGHFSLSWILVLCLCWNSWKVRIRVFVGSSISGEDVMLREASFFEEFFYFI